MAIAQRGSATTVAATPSDLTSLVVDKPTGTVAGDVLIALYTANSISVTPPSGFQLIVSQIADTNALTTKAYYKIAGDSEPSTYDFTSGNGPGFVSLTAWSGCDNINPIGTNLATSGSAGAAETVATPTTNNDAQAGRVFYYRSALWVGTTLITYTGPGGGTSEVLDHGCLRSGSTTQRSHCMYVDDSDFSGGGATKTGLVITANQTDTRTTYGTFTLRAARSTTDYGASVDVFTTGVTVEPGTATVYARVRIPAIVKTAAGTLIAFAEGRIADLDTGNIDIIARRSTDGGANWGTAFKVKENGTDTAGNPVPVINTAGHVVMAYTKEPAAGDGTARYPWVTISTDDGVTWGTSIDLTSLRPSGWTWFATGPGHGIRTASGRLIVPINGNHATDGYLAGCLYSDDGGTNWSISSFVSDATGVRGYNESTIAELPDGTLVMLSRNQIDASYDVIRSVSTNNGLTWGSPSDSTLVHFKVQGCVVQHKDQLIFSGTDHASLRRNMVLRSSTNGGTSWSTLQTVWNTEDAGYSDMCITSGNSVGILYERGIAISTEYVTFMRVPLADITKVGTATTGGVAADATSVLANKPTGVATNDILIGIISANSISVTPPSGWTMFDSDNNGVLYTKLYYKVAGGSEPSDYTWTCASGPIVASIAAFRGCDTAAPIVNSSASTNSATAPEPVTTPEMANDSTNGRMFYVRSSYIASATPITFASTQFVEEILQHTHTTTGNTSRSHALYAWNHGFEGTADIKSGIAITATGTDVANTMFTFALKASTRRDPYWDYSRASSAANSPKNAVGAKAYGIG